MPKPMSYAGKCFCGSVEFKATGDPAAMGYCHCRSCREWSGAPLTGWILYPRDLVEITKGSDNIGSFHRTDRNIRKWCNTCGGHVLVDLPKWDFVELFSASIPMLLFEPTLHIHYEETVLRIKDGLPKQKDLPKDFGGTGELLQD
jgi:hypothetical protein